MSDPLDLLDLLGQGAGGWAGRGPGRRSSEHDPGPRQAPPPGECCYSSSGCSWACSLRGSLQPPSGNKVSMYESLSLYSAGHLTFVSCGLGGPCILQLYMFWAGPAPPGYPGPAPPPGESLLAPDTGSCQEPAPPPGSAVTPWPGACA